MFKLGNMKTRINAIIGLLLMMAGLFSLAVLLTSCSKEEEEEDVFGYTGYTDNGDGSQTTSDGATAIQDSISYTSIALNCVIIGMTEEFCDANGYNIYEYDFEGIGNDFYDEDVAKQEIKKMLKNNKATGASYVYIYEKTQISMINSNAKVKYNIIWKSK